MKNKLIKKYLNAAGTLRPLTDAEKRNLTQTGYTAVPGYAGALVRTLPKVAQIVELVAPTLIGIEAFRQMPKISMPKISMPKLPNNSYVNRFFSKDFSVSPVQQTTYRPTNPYETKLIENETPIEEILSWRYINNTKALDPVSRRPYTTSGYLTPEGAIYETPPIEYTVLPAAEVLAPRVMATSEPTGNKTNSTSTDESTLPTQPSTTNSTSSNATPDPEKSELAKLKKEFDEFRKSSEETIKNLQEQTKKQGLWKRTKEHINRNKGKYGIGLGLGLGVPIGFGLSDSAVPADSISQDQYNLINLELNYYKDQYKKDSTSGSLLNNAIKTIKY